MLSVIIPAHNEEHYIVQTLVALEQQPFRDFETIVVCDGCTDKTFDVVKKRVGKVVVLQERSGPAVAKNAGAKIAKGDVFVFLDADTVVSPTLLEKVAAQTKDAIVGTAKIKPSNPALKHRAMMFLKNYLLCPWGMTNGLLFCTRKTFEEAYGFNGNLQKMEDGTFVRQRARDKKFVLLDDYVVNSTRRFEQLGYLRVMMYWIREAVKASDQKYGVIR